MMEATINGSKSGLTRSEEIQLEKLLANYKLTPMTLAMRLNPRIIPARHLMYISAVVAHAIAKGNGRIIISLPPRHGKSELCTKNVPIWTLENFGRKNVILCSYGGDLSSDFGRQVRDLIKGNEHLLNLRIRPDAERVNNWLTQQGGAMYSVGLGGPITGRGADVLVIDDYIKEIKESLSQLHRDYIWDWFVTTAYTRLEPGATVIIVATRWNHDDLIGRILKHFPGVWTNIVIPAIAEKDDILGRPVGTPLFAERYPLSDLQDRKRTLGAFFFNALYQQRPENDAGKLTNRNWIKILPEFPDLAHSAGGFKVCRTWDLACTEDGGDYIVGTLAAYSAQRDITILLDVVRGQLSPMKVEELVARVALRDGPSVPICIEREPGSSGKLLVENYAANLLKGYNVEAIPANDGKLIRAQPFLAAAEAGKVYIVKSKWNEDWLREYDDFPGGDHDDQVDTAAAAYTRLSGKRLLRASWGRPSDRDVKAQNIIVQQNQLASADINADLNNDLVRLPNGKIYRVTDTSTLEYEEGSNVIPLIPRKAGVVWGRS